MKIFKNRLVLLMMLIVAGTAAGSEPQPSTLEKIYNGAAVQLNKAKKSVAHLFSGEKEEKVSHGMTVAQASLLVKQIIDKKPKDETAALEYWKTKNSVLLRCAKILHEETEKQILLVLQQIDKRLLYWHYQKEHQWSYFFSKNPLKWVMGKKQEVEIETNIEQLQSKQDELYMRLGELSNIDWHEYLKAFNSYQASYAWIEKLLAILSGVKKEVAAVGSSDNYGGIVNDLHEELKKVSMFAATVLSVLADTAMPYHITRNWAKYGALMFAGHLLYNSPEVAALVTPEAVLGYQQSAEKYWKEELLPPAKNIVNKIFFRSVTSEEREKLENSLGTLLDKIAPQQKAAIMNAEKAGNLVPLQEFFNNMKKSGWRLFSKDDVAQVLVLFLQLKAYHVADTLSVLRNIALLTPAAVAGWVSYRGYQRLTHYDYSPIRLALVDISSLFADQTKPLDDAEYGKMIYVIYNLKEKAKKELPLKDRNAFIKDLERIESREFDSAAKRRIVDDMFKKYTFLGLIQ